MKKWLLFSTAWLLAANGFGAALTKAKFTQVINQVRVVSAKTRTIAAAKLNELFNTPDLIQTGPRSLAELRAPDNTITRVGSNTIFSYARSGRTVNLQTGSLLFHSPRGKGGGVIKTKAASASVLGTTLIVSATTDGGFKCVVLEGKAALQMPNGNYRVARPGQVVFVQSGGDSFGPTVDINLEKLVEGSNLVESFEKELPSLPKIKKAVTTQKEQITAGVLTETEEQIAPATGSAAGDSVPTVTKETVEAAVLNFADRFRTAIGTDLIVHQTPFNSDHLFGNGYSTTIPGIDRTSFKGLLAHNLTITPGAGQTSVSLDFSQFLTGNSFDMVADAVLTISSPSLNLFSTGVPTTLTTAGTSPPDPDFELALIGRTGVDITPGASIVAHSAGNFTLGSGTSMSLNNVSIANQQRSLKVISHGELVVNGGTFAATTSGHHVRFRSAGNDVNVSGATFQTQQLQLSAAQELTVNAINVSSVASIALDAATINLSNINFANGTAVTLNSALGQLAANPNTGAASVPGHVNFIQSVSYNNQPAQFFVGSTITIGTTP